MEPAEFVNSLKEGEQVALLGGAGVGKCLPLNAPILTEEGFVEIGSLSVGDEVISASGNSVKVLEIFDNPDLKMCLFTFSDNTQIECCIDHMWTLKRDGKDTYRNYITRGLITSLTKGYKYYVPLISSVLFKSVEIEQPLDPFLIGLCFGSVRNGDEVKLNILTKDRELILDNCLFPKGRRKYINRIINKGRCSEVYLSWAIAKCLDDLGLEEDNKVSWRIPKQYIYTEVINRVKLLLGYLHSRRIDIKTWNGASNFALDIPFGDDLIFIIRSLGGICKVNKKFKSRPHANVLSPNYSTDDVMYYEVEADLRPIPFFGFDRVESKYITKIEYIKGTHPGRCIVVDDPSHLFVTTNFTLTHNSYLIKAIAKENPRLLKLTSTTGISAVNLADEGSMASTINSALGYFNTASLLEGIRDGTVINKLKSIKRYFSFLALEEVSMFSADDLDLLDFAIKTCNSSGRKLGLVVVGDALQLPAVGSFEGRPFAKPFFLAKCWNQFRVVQLRDVKRQGNKDFINCLNKFRVGDTSSIDWLLENASIESMISPSFVGTTIFGINKSVDSFNSVCMNKLKGKSQSYRRRISGKVSGGVLNNIPDEVRVKEGCLVILLVNSWSNGYVNGDLATVMELFSDKVKVSLNRNGEEKIIEYNTVKEMYKDKVIGSVSYLPLKTAYSITTHRSQSLSLDAVQLVLTNNDGNFLSRLHGGLYTALSRVRSVEGLRIVGNAKDIINACNVDPLFLSSNLQ